MIKQIGEVEYDFNVKLGTTLTIKKTFNKSFNEVLSNIDKMDVDDLIKLLYCGLDKDKVNFDEFKQNCYDNLGLMELYELIMSFIKKIQYPGLTEEEIDKKLEEKNKLAQAYKN